MGAARLEGQLRPRADEGTGRFRFLTAQRSRPPNTENGVRRMAYVVSAEESSGQPAVVRLMALRFSAARHSVREKEGRRAR